MAVFIIAVIILTRGVSGVDVRLIQTIGTVNLADKAGVSVQYIENHKLLDGNALGTDTESYAYINLSEQRTLKMDEQTNIHLEQSGKRLKVELDSGNLLFNVAKPLAAGETLEVQMGTMVVGVRGTSFDFCTSSDGGTSFNCFRGTWR